MKFTVSVVITLLLVTLPLAAQAAEIIADDDVYVYTNADIDKLEPLPTGRSVVPARYDTSAHAFVADFIERERARLAADRDYELERERVTIEADRPIGYGERYPWYLRTGYYDTSPTPAPIRSEPPPPSPTQRPHPIFVGRPPVREFVPGLGDSYRGSRD